MKTVFIALSLVASSFFNHSSAADTLESPLAVTSFQSTYAKATDVAWCQVGEFYKISFSLDGAPATALYKADGSLVAFTQNLSSTNLPAGLKASLKKRLGSQWITDLFRVNTEEGTVYFACLETGDSKVILQSAGVKKWTVYSKEVKL